MSSLIFLEVLQEQTRPNQSFLLIDCARLYSFINLHDISKIEEARKTWRNIVKIIKANLEKLTKYDSFTIVSTTIGLDWLNNVRLLWWFVKMLIISGERLKFYDQNYDKIGIFLETILKERHYDSYACCRAILQVCTTTIEHKWRESISFTYCFLI